MQNSGLHTFSQGTFLIAVIFLVTFDGARQNDHEVVFGQHQLICDCSNYC